MSDMERGEQVAYDVARSALRLSSDKEVHVVCLESREEMPADEVEVVEGEDEGLKLHNSRGPQEVLGQNGTVTGLRTIRCQRFSTRAAASIPASMRPISKTFPRTR